MTNTSTPSSRARVILGIIGVSLLLVLALAAGAYWHLERRVWSVGTELIADARALDAARWPRPSHVETPLPGTFGQALKPLMTELYAFRTLDTKLSAEESAQCLDVREGKRPVSELPSTCRSSLERGRSLMERVLRASRTEEAGPPPGLEALADPHHPDHDTLVVFTSLMRSASLQVRLQLDAGQSEGALETCLDALALARDLGHGTGMLGAMVSIGGHKLLFGPCSAALRSVPPTALPPALKALRRIREGLSPFSSGMRQESVQGPLSILGGALEPEQVKLFPDNARALVRTYGSMTTPPQATALFSSLLLRDALIQIYRSEQRMVPLMDLPPGLREPRLAEEERELMHSWNPLLSLASTHFESYARRADHQRAWMDLLVALARVRLWRAEHGEWPSALPPLYPERAVLLPTSLRLQPGPADTLTLLPDEVTLGALKTDMDPKELTRSPFEVTVSP